jgi:Zn-dependent oligopeptidase
MILQPKNWLSLFRTVNCHAIYAQLQADVGLTVVEPQSRFINTFYHMVQGYDAAYYGYAWSEVYGADLYAQFTASRGGCFDASLGRLLRQTVLEPGATQDGHDMLRSFLGRAPSSAPFLRSLGIDATHA